MISERCDLSEFIDKIQYQQVPEIILMAQDETTEAERYYLKRSHRPSPATEQHHAYAEQLKLLITYLRYGVCASGLPKDSIEKINPLLHN